MTPPTASIVLTTINDPVLLEDYYADLSEFGHLQETEVIVIPDQKTPPKAFERCWDLARRGLRVRMPPLEEQECILRNFGLRPGAIPLNSDNRRNVGYLMALASGSEFVISLDDDNYCRPGSDTFTEFAKVLGS